MMESNETLSKTRRYRYFIENGSSYYALHHFVNNTNCLKFENDRKIQTIVTRPSFTIFDCKGHGNTGA